MIAYRSGASREGYTFFRKCNKNGEILKLHQKFLKGYLSSCANRAYIYFRLLAHIVASMYSFRAQAQPINHFTSIFWCNDNAWWIIQDSVQWPLARTNWSRSFTEKFAIEMGICALSWTIDIPYFISWVVTYHQKVATSWCMCRAMRGQCNPDVLLSIILFFFTFAFINA